MTKESYSQNEAEITLGLLRVVHQNSSVTQRSAAQTLGVALGLVNTYLRRCAKKGFVKVKHIPSRRYAYYLTPKGFAEKSRLTAEFLGQSLNLFKQAKNDYLDLLDYCYQHSLHTVMLFGVSELTEIFLLCSRDYNVEIKGIVDAKYEDRVFSGYVVYRDLIEHEGIDAFIIASLEGPQIIYDRLVDKVSEGHVLAPRLLEILKKPRLSQGKKRK